MSKNFELPHHMEQIRIRQPKMTAAQSFIQILGIFLAILFLFIPSHFSHIENNKCILKTAKTIGNTGLRLEKSLNIYQKGKSLKVNKLRI